MSPIAIREYVQAMRLRYLGAPKGERGRLLDEFCAVTGYHRKAAVRVLRHPPRGPTGRGRPRQYGLAVAQALRQVWEASDRLCSKRLAAFLPELVAALERHSEVTLAASVRAQLLAMSPATMDRLLRPYRPKGLRHPHPWRPAPSALKAQIPLRTFGEWSQVSPGALQADLVLHCSESTAGFYLTTLVVVDVASGWTDCEAVWGMGQQRVGSALHQVRQRLPIPLRELHTDNGSEFLNGVLYPYCQRTGIRLTRGRPYKKNDQAYVEQKNWAVVRRLVGYDRYDTRAAYEQLQRLYAPVRRYQNFFQPLSKLLTKERMGAKVKKRYDVARTPYQRLLQAGVLTASQQQALEQEYQRLNPVRLRADINAALEALWKLADRGSRLRSGTWAEDKGKNGHGNPTFEARAAVR